MQDSLRITSIQVLRSGINGSGRHCDDFPLDRPALLLNLERPFRAALPAYSADTRLNASFGLTGPPLPDGLPWEIGPQGRPLLTPSRNSSDRHASDLVSDVLSQSDDDYRSDHRNEYRPGGPPLLQSAHSSLGIVTTSCPSNAAALVPPRVSPGPCVYLGDGTLETVGVMPIEDVHATAAVALALTSEIRGPMGVRRSTYSTTRPSLDSHLSFVTEDMPLRRLPSFRTLPSGGLDGSSMPASQRIKMPESGRRPGCLRSFGLSPEHVADASNCASARASERQHQHQTQWPDSESQQCGSDSPCDSQRLHAVNTLDDTCLGSWHLSINDKEYESASLSESTLATHTASSATSGAWHSAKSWAPARRDVREPFLISVDVSVVAPKWSQRRSLDIPSDRIGPSAGIWPSRVDRKTAPAAMTLSTGFACKPPKTRAAMYLEGGGSTIKAGDFQSPQLNWTLNTDAYYTDATLTTNSNMSQRLTEQSAASSDLGLQLDPSELASRYARAEDLMLHIGLQWDRINVLLVNQVRRSALFMG